MRFILLPPVFIVVAFSLSAVACGGTSQGPSNQTQAVAGAGDAGTRDPIFDSLTGIACLDDDEAAYGVPKSATLATGVDFIGTYTYLGQTKSLTKEALQLGEACNTATQKAACLSTLAEPGTGEGWRRCACPGSLQVRVTRGDSVEVISDKRKVFAAFLPIDSAAEALAVVAATGTYDKLGCTGKDVRADADGTYLVYTKTIGLAEGCPPKAGGLGVPNSYDEEKVTRVKADGTTEIVATYRSAASETCY